MSEGRQAFVIVGAGLAGAKAAETLRDEGFEGRITLVGEEPERPYERPPLSKDYLRGETTDPPYVHDEDFYSTHEIELLTETRVSGLDPEVREVALEDGKRLPFDRLLITTGAAPRRLDVPGAELDGIHYLRTLADSQRLGAELSEGVRLAVIGAGWIGAEIAASARQRGCEVTMLDLTTLPLERVLGPEIGRIYLDVHREHGVEFRPGTGVERFEGGSSVERVVTGDGEAIEADLVVVGVGVTPRTELAEAAGLRVKNGILVDERLETSVSGIFAAGDVANQRHPFYGHRLRVEHWANALNQGPVAARAMLGKEVRYDEIPYFFSDQYETGMEYSGYASDWDEVVFRGDVAGREFIAFWLQGKRLVAGMNMNIWDVTDPIRELIRSNVAVSPRELADPDIPLADLMPVKGAAGAAVAGGTPS